MSEPSPLRRKIGTPRPNEGPPPLTPARLWRRAVTHGLTRSIGLDTRIDGVELDTILLDQIAERVENGALAAFLDGPLGYGVIVVSRGLVAAILETLTLGGVRARPVPDRAITATDTSMLADPLDRILAAQQMLVSEMVEPQIATGYRFATRIEKPREIALTLDDATHDVTTVSVTAGGLAERAGTILIVLPRVPPARDPDMSDDWSTRIETRVMGAEVALRTELARLSLSVEALRNLKPGDSLTLGRHAISNVQLIGPAGETLGVGRLGQSCGRKALRIGATPQSFTAISPPKRAAVLESASLPPGNVNSGRG